MKNSFSLLLVLLFGSTVVDSDEICPTDCTTWSESIDGKGNNKVKCMIQNELCSGLNIKASYISAPTIDYDVFVQNNSLVLNITFQPGADLTIKLLQGFWLQVNVIGHYVNKSQLVEKYFCLEDSEKSFYNHSNMKFSFDCINNLLPEDSFNISIKSLPLHHYTFVKTKKGVVPSCARGKGFENVAFCRVKPNLTVISNQNECSDFVAVSVQVPAQLGPQATIMSYPSGQKLWSKTIDTNAMTYKEDVIFKKPYEFGNYTLVLYGTENVNVNSSVDISIFKCYDYKILLSLFCVLVTLSLIFLLGLFLYIRHHKREAECSREINTTMTYYVESEVKPFEHSTKVYLGYYDTDPVFLSLIDQFACYLTTSLGFEVTFEQWSCLEVEQGLSQWVEKALQSCDKFILAWSSASIELLDYLNEAPANEHHSTFVPIALQLKSELLKGTMKKNNFLSVYFDAHYAKMIPRWFCRLIDRHFFLMEQFNELYFSIVDQEPFNPGKKLVVDFNQVEKKFENIIKRYRRSSDHDDKLIELTPTNQLEVVPPNFEEVENKDLILFPPKTLKKDGLETNILSIVPPFFEG